MRWFKLTITLLASASIFGQVSPKQHTSDYISKWENVAIEQMELYGIPASITMAQAVLESGSGRSELARNANNHFGIKCHKWGGPGYTMDDDKKDECFRKYKDAKRSFLDHSEFLKHRGRYAFLFEYDIKDYKKWAKGLKKAGYATNPKYAELLIKIIEDYELHKLDNKSFVTPMSTKGSPVLASANFNQHKVHRHVNKISYIVVRKGDTFYRIAKEFEMGLWQLYKYNDFGRKDNLIPGDIVYLQPKRNKTKKKKKKSMLSKQLSLRDVSQFEGIKLKKLMEYNDFSDPDALLASGTEVYLTKR